MDFESIVEDLNKIDEQGLNRIAILAKKQLELEKEIESAESNIKYLKSELKKVQETDIPGLLSELGISSFKLPDGSEVSVKPYYSISIPKEQEEAAYQWLVDNNFGDLIKNVVANNFVRGQEQEADKFAQECIDRGLSTSTKRWVEPMTLKAWAKEQMQKGTEVPGNLFGIFMGKKATIKRS